MTKPDDLIKDKGTIIAHHGLKVRIDRSGQIIEHKPPRRESWVVGDIVRFEGDKPVEIIPRRNQLVRHGSGGGDQVLAANLDALVIVTSCGEAFKPGLIDRFIVAARNAGIEPVIVLNKIDLPDYAEKRVAISLYSKLGFEVHHTSAETGDGVEGFMNSLKDKISSMVGHSGVGKTSLLNRLIPELKRGTAEIHDKTGQGRHKTSFALLVNLPNGGSVIDSPGVRQFTPSELEPVDVAIHFPGFDAIKGQCKFRNCLHLTEPGCIILEAVKAKEFDEELYLSYTRLIGSVQENQEPSYLKNKR